MKILKPIVLVGAILIIVSCEKQTEETLPTESTLIDTTLDTENTFVITKSGDQISEEEYLKLRATRFNNAKNNSHFRRVMTSRDLNNNGMSGSDEQQAMARYTTKAPKWRRDQRQFVGGMSWTFRHENRNICSWYNFPHRPQYFAQCKGSENPATWELRRKEVRGAKVRTIQGPFTLQVINERGRRDRAVTLSGRAYSYERSTEESLEFTNKVNAKLTFKVSSKFLGAGVDFGTEIGFESGINTKRTKKESRTDVINWQNGDVVPKGKRCDFRIIAEKREEERNYSLDVHILGDANVTYVKPFGKDPVTVFERNSIWKAFPNHFRNIPKQTYKVKSTFWRYSKKRENCRNL
ncbi:hypothetical protein [Aquimarina aggregata]|uniref:hypothetical protein n=1 Tax=Aquimarina aggregata TaxID=1642818 RepID=UPI0024932B88|nr:hypothetical protein [Aquimarina aggregata]